MSFSVVVAGATVGTIYDSNSVSSTPAANALSAVPNVIGIYKAGQIFLNGLVISPGTGQSINITYSTG